MTALIFGAFCAFLADYWLGRATVREPVRIILSVAFGVIMAMLVFVGRLAAF